MIRTTTLSAAALLGLTLLVPAGAAQAAGETCRGQAATVVGTDNQRLVGTEGHDVIVSNGAQSVDALGGDDLVCVTGAVVGSPSTARVAVVDAGAGNDTVEVATERWSTRTVLGAGADTFLADNGAEHTVTTGEMIGTGGHWWDSAADVVRVSAGRGDVSTGQVGLDNPDIIELAEGGVVWRGRQVAPSTLSAGGAGYLVLSTEGTNVSLDNRRHERFETIEGSLDFAGFTTFDVSVTAPRAVFGFVGGPSDEHLVLRAPDGVVRRVLMGLGDDLYASDGVGARRSFYSGGTGSDRDRLLLSLPRHQVDVDLVEERVVATRGGHRSAADVTDFEDVTLGARHAIVGGNRRSQQIAVSSCRAEVRAGAGNDTVSFSDEIDDTWVPPVCSSHRMYVDGGRGKDVIHGSPGSDRLIGGRGRDLVDGRGGHDTCQAEKRRSCEVRR